VVPTPAKKMRAFEAMLGLCCLFEPVANHNTEIAHTSQAVIAAPLTSVKLPGHWFGRSRAGGGLRHGAKPRIHHQEAKRRGGLCCQNDANFCRETRFAIFTGFFFTART